MLHLFFCASSIIREILICLAHHESLNQQAHNLFWSNLKTACKEMHANAEEHTREFAVAKTERLSGVQREHS
jgi:hypothetical protein